MEDLTWDASQTVANMPILWSTSYTQLEDIEEGGYSYGYSMPNLDSSVNVLNHVQETQKPAPTDHLYSNSQPCPSLSASDFAPHYFNSMPQQQKQQQQLLINGGASRNDVTQEDEDGNVSMILPHCGSSNASASAAFDGTRRNKDMQCHVNKVDDTVSQTTSSSHPHIVNQSEIVESGGKNKDIQCHVNILDETVSQSTYTSHPCVNQGKIVESKPDCGKRSSFRLISEDNNNPPKPNKRPRWDHHNRPCPSNINFQQPNSCISSNWNSSTEEPDPEAIAHMKEMIYRAAAFRPVNLGLEVLEKPRRKNVRISSDPQTVAARQRRERISERIRVLQKLVPGGSKMDTASMLDEAANYLKFLRSQVKALEGLGNNKHIIDSINFTPFSFINPSCNHI